MWSPAGSFAVSHADFVGQFAKWSLRPVPNYVSRPRPHQKIKAQWHDLNDDEKNDVWILTVCGLDRSDKSQLVLNYI